jgi:RNA polymerase sigma factor FliA
MAHDLQIIAERYVADPSPAHRQAVAIAALPLVRSLTRRMNLPDHPLASIDDLTNVGMLGMLQTLDGYDPARGTSFASFAFGRIRGALIDYIRSIDTMSRDRRRRFAEAQRASDRLQQELGAEPRGQQVADAIGLSIEEYHGLLTDAQGRFTLSLHDSEGSEHRSAPVEVIPHPVTYDDQERVERHSLFEHVCHLMERLPARERSILSLYFFDSLTLREIAGQMNLTEARISQILSKSLLTLRSQLLLTRTAA